MLKTRSGLPKRCRHSIVCVSHASIVGIEILHVWANDILEEFTRRHCIASWCDSKWAGDSLRSATIRWARPREQMVTKMLANSGPRVGIERDGTARAADFRNTNQHLWGQNETGRNGHQQISSAVLSIKPRTCKCLVGPSLKSRGSAGRSLQCRAPSDRSTWTSKASNRSNNSVLR
jgi:hypothetical protein